MTSLALQVLPLFGKVLDGAIAVVQTLTGKKKTAAADHSWQPPTPTDRRSPCPMLNALANHGYLPRDGKDVSLADLVTGFKESINLAPEATFLVTVKALQASSTGNFLTLHLDDLNKHNSMSPLLPFPYNAKDDQHPPVIEHDGSLSRADFHSGDNHTFQPALFASFLAHLGNHPTISIPAAASARLARLAEARAANPEFSMSPENARFSFIETASYLQVFGKGLDGDARADWLRVFFEQERLPFDEGFVRADKAMTVAGLFEVQRKVEEATKAVEGTKKTA